MKTIKVKLIDNSTYYINTDNIDYIVGSAYSIMDIHIPEGKDSPDKKIDYSRTISVSSQKEFASSSY